MSIDGLPVRFAIMAGLLAIVPALWYGFGRAGYAGVVTAVNVLIIIAALYVATGPVLGSHHHADEEQGH